VGKEEKEKVQSNEWGKKKKNKEEKWEFLEKKKKGTKNFGSLSKFFGMTMAASLFERHVLFHFEIPIPSH